MNATLSSSFNSSSSTLKSTDISTLETSNITEDVTFADRGGAIAVSPADLIRMKRFDGTGGESGVSSDDLRRKKRLQRNRVSAERSRRRRLSRIEELSAENERLRKVLASLQAMEVENRRLKREIELRRSLQPQKAAVQQPLLQPAANFVQSHHVSNPSQQSFVNECTPRDSISDVEKLCHKESNYEPFAGSWSVGYEAPWLEQARVARAAIARQLSNYSTGNMS
ncbi:hypothetical protein GAYE_SCF28MG4738 [Galdieria yellowstonensis]|uniref:BZIP domain-containing protein n=1 Tax=Galdieria yellowstonensis TaxID=3028027 RepID=A0AAV9II15_9RHOD|nr:hypothetical protein GAYE_SCF28MG4738 [Galdieria yellowstonensis]